MPADMFAALSVGVAMIVLRVPRCIQITAWLQSLDFKKKIFPPISTLAAPWMRTSLCVVSQDQTGLRGQAKAKRWDLPLHQKLQRLNSMWIGSPLRFPQEAICRHIPISDVQPLRARFPPNRAWRSAHSTWRWADRNPRRCQGGLPPPATNPPLPATPQGAPR